MQVYIINKVMLGKVRGQNRKASRSLLIKSEKPLDDKNVGNVVAFLVAHVAADIMVHSVI